MGPFRLWQQIHSPPYLYPAVSGFHPRCQPAEYLSSKNHPPPSQFLIFPPISLPPWFGGAAHVSWCQTDLFFLPAALYQVHQCSVQPEGGAGAASLHLLGGTRLSRTRPKTATGCFGFFTLAGLRGGVSVQKCRIWRQTKVVNKQHLSFPWSLLSPLSHAALRE